MNHAASMAIGALAGFAFTYGLWLVICRLWRRNRYIQARSPEHDVLVLALDDWLRSPEVTGAMVQAGVATRASLRSLRLTCGRMSEPMFRASVAALLQPRSVRRALAKHLVKDHGADRHRAMEALMELAEAGR